MPNKNKIWILPLLACLSAVVDWGLTLATLVFFVQHFGGSVSTFAMLATSFMLLQTLTVPLWGRLSDRIGRRQAFLIGLVGSTASILLLSFSNSVAMIFFARCLGGLFGGNVAILSAAMADLSSPERRAKNMGLIESGVSAGLFLVGPTIGGLLYSVNPGAPYMAGAGIGCLNFILGWIFLKDNSTSIAKASSLSIGIKLGYIPALKYLLKSPVATGGLLLMFIVGLCKAPTEVCLAPYLRVLIGNGPKENAILTSIFGITVFVTQSFMFGPLVKKFGEITVAKTGFYIGFFGVIMMSLLGTSILPANNNFAAILMIIDGIGFALIIPAAASLVSKGVKDPAMKGGAMGTFRACNSVGKLSTPLAGFLFESAGPRVPFIYSQIFWVIGLLTIKFWKWDESPDVAETYTKKVQETSQ